MYCFPQKHTCQKCGQVFQFSSDDQRGEFIVIDGNPVCPKCCESFVKSNCGIGLPDGMCKCGKGWIGYRHDCELTEERSDHRLMEMPKFHVKEPIIGIGDGTMNGPLLIEISKVDGEVWLAPSLRNESEAARLFWAALHEAAFDKELEAEIGAAKAIKRAKVGRSDERLMEMPWKKIQKTPEQRLAEHIDASAARHLREMRDSWLGPRVVTIGKKDGGYGLHGRMPIWPGVDRDQAAQGGEHG